MAGLIPQPFIDELLDRIDIVDVVDSRVKLKKTGKNYSACCPFHDEKTPSFTVSPDKQFYYCFGCGASGSALNFILEYDNLSFPDAVELLAKQAGVEVPREASEPSHAQKQRRSLYELLERADRYYRQQLKHSPARGHAIEYLRRRGLTGIIARDYGIGYAPPGWDNLLVNLGTSDEERNQLTLAGMLIEKEDSDRRYDRFRNRIMFPIRDVRGRVIGFGGRVLDDSKPKYLNSPETPIFHKGRELYGLYQAKQSNRELKRLIVVEGYMDVVALAQFGITQAVATLGTACGTDHLNLAFKHTNEVVFCFDGDRAGHNAAKRALESALPAMSDGRQVKFLFLPDGEDPDTMVRQIGAEKFERRLDSAVPLEDFIFDSQSEDIDTQTMEGRARLSRRVAPMLHHLPTGIFKELMFGQLASRTGISHQTLMDILEPETPAQPEITNDSNLPPVEEAIPSQVETPAAPPPVPLWHAPQPASRVKLSAARRLCGLILQHPELASQNETAELNKLADSQDPELLRFLDILELIKNRPNLNCNSILGLWRANHGESAAIELGEIASTESLIEARHHGNFDAPTEYSETLTRLLCELDKKKRDQAIFELSRKNLNELSESERQQLLENLGNRHH